MLDWDYRRIRDKMMREREGKGREGGFSDKKDVAGIDVEKGGDINFIDDFPIEMARLRTMPVYSFFFISVLLGYGWCIQAKVSIAGPLIMQFLSKSAYFNFVCGFCILCSHRPGSI